MLILTPVLASASTLVSLDVQFPEGEDLSNDLQLVYSAQGGGYETFCARTSQSLDCDIVGSSLHNGIDLMWGDQKVFDEGQRQIVVLTTEKAIFLVVTDNGLVDIDQIGNLFEEAEISVMEALFEIETNSSIKTQEPIETSTPSPAEDNNCGHYGPHLGTPVNGDAYFCKGGN